MAASHRGWGYQGHFVCNFCTRTCATSSLVLLESSPRSTLEWSRAASGATPAASGATPPCLAPIIIFQIWTMSRFHSLQHFITTFRYKHPSLHIVLALTSYSSDAASFSRLAERSNTWSVCCFDRLNQTLSRVSFTCIIPNNWTENYWWLVVKRFSFLEH